MQSRPARGTAGRRLPGQQVIRWRPEPRGRPRKEHAQASALLPQPLFPPPLACRRQRRAHTADAGAERSRSQQSRERHCSFTGSPLCTLALSPGRRGFQRAPGQDRDRQAHVGPGAPRKEDFRGGRVRESPGHGSCMADRPVPAVKGSTTYVAESYGP